MLPDFFLFSFPCSADHERDWPPCKVVFFELATKYAERDKQQPAVLLRFANFVLEKCTSAEPIHRSRPSEHPQSG